MYIDVDRRTIVMKSAPTRSVVCTVVVAMLPGIENARDNRNKQYETCSSRRGCHEGALYK